MSQLKQLITDDMKLALKAQDKSALKAIRMILGAIKQKEIDERKCCVIYVTHIFDGLEDWATKLIYMKKTKLKLSS